MADRVITVIMSGFTTLNNSVYGNPRFTLHTDEGDIMTSSDCADSYGVRNGWTVDHVTKKARTVRLTLTRAGRAQNLTYLDGDN